MITVYTTTACAYCKMVKQYLTLKGKEFTVVNLEENPEKRQELFEKTGALTVPITQVGDDFVIGWNRQKFAEVL
jgi:glutaredoxin